MGGHLILIHALASYFFHDISSIVLETWCVEDILGGLSCCGRMQRAWRRVIRHVLQLMVFVRFESHTCLYRTYDKILKDYGD